MADDSTSNKISADSIDFSSIFGAAMPFFSQLIGNLIADPGLREGISGAGADFARGTASIMGADFSMNAPAGTLSRWMNGTPGNLQQDAFLGTIGNLLSTMPMFQRMFGGSDFRIYQGALNQISAMPYGILGDPKQYVDKFLINENMNAEITRMLDSNSPFKRGMNQGILSLGYRNLAARGAITADEFRNGIPKETSDSMMQTLWIGKTMLNMGDNVDAILATAGEIGGGGKGKNFKDAMKTFQQYMKDLVATGVHSYEEIQAITQGGIQQIQALKAQGFDAASAASMARTASIGAAAFTNKMRAEGVDVDQSTIANTRISQQAFYRMSDEGFERAAGLRAIENAEKLGEISSAEASRIRQEFVKTGRFTGRHAQSLRRGQAATKTIFNNRRTELALTNPESLSLLGDSEREYLRKNLTAQWIDNLRAGGNDNFLKEHGLANIDTRNMSTEEMNNVLKIMATFDSNQVAGSLYASIEEGQIKKNRAQFANSIAALAGVKKSGLDIQGVAGLTKEQEKMLDGPAVGTEEYSSLRARIYDTAHAKGMSNEQIQEIIDAAIKTNQRFVEFGGLGKNGERIFYDTQDKNWLSMSKEAQEKAAKEEKEKEVKNNPMLSILTEILNALKDMLGFAKDNKLDEQGKKNESTMSKEEVKKTAGKGNTNAQTQEEG